ncbi:MAG TPA: hypothetical protein VF665_09120 [Longimicrobium sp.]|jgi:hypothetical protein|uniref:hypothetical protein n=1 Tax=Longimicrobium sp. TaxID=2029185 RepID=UPI002EDADA80
MKYHRLLLPALLASTPALGQRGVLFGVYDPDSFIEGNATRFIGCHDGREFHSTGCPVRVDTMSTGDEMRAVDGSGRTARVRVEQVYARTGDLYEAPYALSVHDAGPEPGAPMLFWQADAGVRLLAPRAVTLDTAALALLRAEAVRLYQRAEALRAPGDRSESLVLGTPVVRVVEGESRVAVYWPAALAYGSDRDTRASLFFVYDPGARRVVSARFGHPEWAPMRQRDTVCAVEPLLFFRVGSDARTYILARDTGPWEYVGFGVYDLRTGERVLRSR